jgi:hypothetical protein
MSRMVAGVIAAAVSALVGCNNGGSTPVRLFFGMANSAACEPLEIFVDLDQSGAILVKRGDGSPDCNLDAQLVADGCLATCESANDAELTVEITNCEAWEATLFECGFRNVDLTRLNAAVHAACDCADEAVCYLNGSTCYRTPELCVTQNPAGDDCENCSNHRDDDGDGASDCDDGNCWLDCGVGLTTITCPPSSTLTTTPPSTTLTSLTTTTTLEGGLTSLP